ncbi:MAG TPA: hypothetical protein VFX16_12990 [Pseudonocardiaceae bacterium]|nr:hypothetical protein [Pseudonocardiaceae bacterium]
MLLAVGEVTKDVVVPLVAAGIAATGIVVPVLLFRRQETTKALVASEASEVADRKKKVDQLRNTVLLLRELVQRFGLEKSLTTSQQEVVAAARNRLFEMIYSDYRLFEYIVPAELGKPRFITKMMLTLGEVESRLGGTFTPQMAGDPVLQFGIYTLCYLLETEPKEKAEDLQVLTYLAGSDPEAAALFEVLYGTVGQH